MCPVSMNEYDEILISLRRIMRATDINSQKLARESGLTTPQLLVMLAIEKEGNPSTSTLARHIAVSQATVTRIIDRLERARLVGREKASQDRRVVNVSLTDAGRAKLAAAPTPLQASFLREYGKLEDWERHMLRSSLLRIAKMMDAEDLPAAAILETGDIAESQDGE
jgi:DNA-binding MarR family transcriptional regulator